MTFWHRILIRNRTQWMTMYKHPFRFFNPFGTALPHIVLAVSLLMVPRLSAQSDGATNPTAPFSPETPKTSKLGSAEQTAQIFNLDGLKQRLLALRGGRDPSAPLTPEEMGLRQQLLLTVQADLLDIDGVLSEISNERNELGDLKASLQMRRDKTVGHLTTAALLTGSGLGIAVNATQFTTLGNRTQNIGDGIGIGSGVASTLLSILAARKQSGPTAPVLETPNMLAPLLGGIPVLNTYYPPTVLRYLQTVPAGEDPARGTRLDQLKERWIKSGRLDGPGSSKEKDKLQAAAVSGERGTKVSIDDLNNRIGMLGDVAGAVSLIKRDLGTLLRQETQGLERPRK